MHMLRHRLRRLTWIPLFAIVGLALLPTLSHALAWLHSDGGWVEVCSAQGPRRVLAGVAAADGSAPVPAASHLQHCPMCALSGAPLHTATLAPAWQAPASPRIAAAPVPLAATRPATRHTACPRGPPIPA